MKKIYKKLLLVSMLFIGLAATKIQAASQETLTVVCVIGTEMLVKLDQNLILAEVDAKAIKDAKSNPYLLGAIQVGLFNNNASGTDSLKITSPNSEGTLFRSIKTDGSNKAVYLSLTTDHNSLGIKLAKPISVNAGDSIRTYASALGRIIENEVHNHTFYAVANDKGSTDSGTYEATVLYTWVSA